jgi:hypothetical protein
MSPQLRHSLAYITVGILRGANDARLRMTVPFSQRWVVPERSIVLQITAMMG